jgi:hypothetical protein
MAIMAQIFPIKDDLGISKPPHKSFYTPHQFCPRQKAPLEIDMVTL